MAEVWTPALADVARHIPTRTRDKTPGSDALLGTFTPATTPTGDQAQEVIDDAVAGVLAQVGDLPTAGNDLPNILRAAKTAAEWRAAADIEVAYPVRDADVRVYAQLDARAKDALATLLMALRTETGGPMELVPIWQAPTPVPWGDDLLM
jgi:hypothetical protein